MAAALTCAASGASAQTCSRDIRDVPGPFTVGDTTNPTFELTNTYTGGYAIASICVLATVDRLADGTRASDLRVTILRGNTVVVNDQPLSTNNDTSAGGSVTFSASFPLPGIGPGNFRFRFRDSVDQPGPDAALRDIRLAATSVGSSGGGGGAGNGPDNPPVDSLDFSGSGFAFYPPQFLRADSNNVPPPGERLNAPTVFYRVVLPDDYNRFTGRYLDLITDGSQLIELDAMGNPIPVPPEFDILSLSSAFYSANGQLLGFDAFSGRELTTALLFGAGSSLDVNLRPGETSVPDPYDRYFSAGDGGELTRGEYFLAVSQYQAEPKPNFFVDRLPPRREYAVIVNVGARWGSRPVVRPTVPPTPTFDLGTNPNGVERVVTLAADEVAWFKFQASGISEFQRDRKSVV